MTTATPSVAIAILNWNGKFFLESLLPELLKITYPNYTVYIIDNNSSDGSADFVRQSYQSVIVIQLDNNYGFAGGYNRGLRQIKQDYFLMMNSDVEISKSFIEPLVNMMETDKRIAVCQPKILSQINHSMFEYAGAAGGMIDFLGYPFCRGRIFETVEPNNKKYDANTEIFWASGACCLIRREAFEQTGGLYEYYFMHSEEIDLCWQMIAKGWKIAYCPESFIYHLGGGSLSYQASRKTYLNFRNNIVMCMRNSPAYINSWLLPTRFFLDIAAAFQFLLKKDFTNFQAVLKAYRDVIKWLLTEKNKWLPQKKSLLSIPVVFKKSIVWQYFIKGRKTYHELTKNVRQFIS